MRKFLCRKCHYRYGAIYDFDGNKIKTTKLDCYYKDSDCFIQIDERLQVHRIVFVE